MTVTPVAPSLSLSRPLLKGEALPQTPTKSSSGFTLWGDDGFSFADILDILNPLQHIPVVATIYRALTGDMLAPAPRVLGDTLFGGAIGAATGVANALLEYASGKDAGAHVLALLHIPSTPLPDAQDAPVMLADARGRAAEFSTPASPKVIQASLQQDALRRAADQQRFLAALDAYAKNNRLLRMPNLHEYRGGRL
jgi:hypothetical protein